MPVGTHIASLDAQRLQRRETLSPHRMGALKKIRRDAVAGRSETGTSMKEWLKLLPKLSEGTIRVRNSMPVAGSREDPPGQRARYSEASQAAGSDWHREEAPARIYFDLVCCHSVGNQLYEWMVGFGVASLCLDDFRCMVSSSLAGGALLHQLLPSIERIFTGFFLAAAAAIPLGLLMGTIPFFYLLFEPITDFTWPIPSSAYVPVAILFLGIHDPMKNFIVFVGCFFPILLNTVSGVRGVDQV